MTTKSISNLSRILTKDRFIHLYLEQNKSMTEIAKDYNVAPNTVFILRKKYNIPKKPNRTPRQEYPNENLAVNRGNLESFKSIVLDLYSNEKKSMVEIAEQFGVTRQAVYKFLKKYGVSTRNNLQARNLAVEKGKLVKYQVNEDFFKEWSKEMAWVLGWIISDGSIFSDKFRSSRLAFTISDIEILKKFKKVMNSTHKIRIVKPSNRAFKASKELYRLDIASEPIVSDLLKLAVTPNKTRTALFPDVPDEYLHHFIRGYFEGDGSVYKESNTNKALRVSFTCGSYSFIKALQHKLTENFYLTPRKIYEHKNANAYYIRYGEDDSIKFFNSIYSEETSHIMLDRKYNTFKSYFHEKGYYVFSKLVKKTNKIILLSDDSLQMPKKSIAKDLYVGKIFRYRLKFAHSMKPDKICILSAKYGLINLHDEIEPYSTTLSDLSGIEFRQWMSKTIKQFKEETNVNYDEHIFLTSFKNFDQIREFFSSLQIPTDNMFNISDLPK